MTKTITAKIPEELFEKLDLFAMNNWMSRSEVVREALECYLNGNCVVKMPINPLRLKSSKGQVF
jgi:metal-responsive CopG/Arc/MetJ family transcriptional regulator